MLIWACLWLAAASASRCFWQEAEEDVRPFRRLRGKAAFVWVFDERGHFVALHDMKSNWASWSRYFFAPQHMSVLLAFEATSFSGSKHRYLSAVDLVGLEPADEGTAQLVSNHRATKVHSAKPWLDELPPTLNFSTRDADTGMPIAVEVVHFRMPLPTNVPGLFVLEDEEAGELEWIYNGTREPSWCASTTMYARGCGVYVSDAFWELPAVRDSDFIAKVDLDIRFFGFFPFSLMSDMWARQALLAHAGQYCNGDYSCVAGFKQAKVRVTAAEQLSFCVVTQRDAFNADVDMFYANFAIMRTAFFTDERAMRFMAAMQKERGWWANRWTDQLLLHQICALLLVDPFRHIVDYSQFRCTRRDWNESEGAWVLPAIWSNIVEADGQDAFDRNCGAATFHHGRLNHDWHLLPPLRQQRPVGWETPPSTEHARIYALDATMCPNARV